MATRKTTLNVIDLFSGVGGLSYGFAHDGRFDIVAANEILPSMARAYALNHPGVKMYEEDIKTFSAAKVEHDLGIRANEIDIVIGGPPCQAYSTVGKRLIDDPRGKLYREYHRVLKEFDPKLFVFENVRGLLSMQGGKLLASIVALFESLGYSVKYKLLNAADYGAPQIRERVIIVGSKLNDRFEYPEPTHSDPRSLGGRGDRRPWLTLRDAIGDLPFIASGEEGFSYAKPPQNDFQRRMRIGAPARLQDHNAPNNNPKLVKLMKALPEGGTPEDLPESLRPTSGFKNTYCRLWWDRPSTTVTRNLGTPSSSRCIHPGAARALTTREGARLQCFPDSYRFFGTRSDRNLQVGNAVPTVLSGAIAASIARHFDGTDDQVPASDRKGAGHQSVALQNAVT